MASSVTNISSTIDINFPKQGESISSVYEFQANFKKINESFKTLAKEATDHLKNTIQVSNNNDFGGNIIKGFALQNPSYRINDLGSVSNGVINLNYREGIYHKCTVESGYYTFNVQNWNSNNAYNKIRLELYNQSTATSSTFFIGFSGDVTYLGTPTSEIVLTGNTSIFYDVWTINKGLNLYVKPIGSLSVTSSSYYTSGGGGGGGGGPLPTISSVVPGLFGSSGYEGITIIGTNFVAGTYVRINNITITTSTASPTNITFISSPNAPGTVVSLQVFTPNGSTSTVVYYIDNSGGGGGDGGGPSE